jgi:hypothetical protein
MVKEEIATLVETVEEKRADSLSARLVPTPTLEYRSLRKLTRAAVAPANPPAPSPVPPIIVPVLRGPRVLIWKQDPTVAEIGIRKAFLHTLVSSGPRDARVQIVGLPVVGPNAMGDFIQTPLTAEFDAVHTFAVVRMTLTMYQRALAVGGTPAALPWQWNNASNADPIQVAPRHSQMMNAFYSRTSRQLAFGFFTKPGSNPPATVFTCRSFDIVAHECGHAILDALKPSWILNTAPPQTGALHEAFGDLTAVFLALSQLDQVEAVIAQTKANLHDKTFLSDVAEEFGLALGQTFGLRNADNDLTLSQVGTQVHSLSRVFTGAIYDVLSDIFVFERRPAITDDAVTLHRTAQYLQSLLLRGIQQSPAANATFADVANRMLNITVADTATGRITAAQATAYRNFIRNRFTVRQVVVAPVPFADIEAMRTALAEDVAPDAELVAADHISLVGDQPQDRLGCCGTMTLPEHNGIDAALEQEKKAFLESLTAELEARKRAAKETK